MILVLSGPPGVGKSTVARLVADQWPLSVHLAADTFWHHVRGGYVPPWLPAAHRQNEVVLAAVAASARAFSAGGYDVVVDGVVGPWLLAPFLDGIGAHSAIHYVVLHADEASVLARAQGRGEGALVEGQPLRHMYAEFSQLGNYGQYAEDTTQCSPEQTAARVRQLLERGTHRLPAGDATAT